MQVHYCPNQITKAAKFLFKKNKALQGKISSVKELEKNILQGIQELLSKALPEFETEGGTHFIACAGYWILAIREDKDLVSVEVLVDPAVSKEPDIQSWPG